METLKLHPLPHLARGWEKGYFSIAAAPGDEIKGDT